MFKAANIIPTVALGACILAMHQVQATPLQVRAGGGSGNFVLAQETTGDLKWVTVPFLGYWPQMGNDIKQVQERFNFEAVPFKLKPYKGDDSTVFEFRWEPGFSAATVIGKGDRPDSDKVVAKTADGRVSCVIPSVLVGEPAFKLSCKDSSVPVGDGSLAAPPP